MCDLHPTELGLIWIPLSDGPETSRRCAPRQASLRGASVNSTIPMQHGGEYHRSQISQHTILRVCQAKDYLKYLCSPSCRSTALETVPVRRGSRRSTMFTTFVVAAPHSPHHDQPGALLPHQQRRPRAADCCHVHRVRCDSN